MSCRWPAGGRTPSHHQLTRVGVGQGCRLSSQVKPRPAAAKTRFILQPRTPISLLLGDLLKSLGFSGPVGFPCIPGKGTCLYWGLEAEVYTTVVRSTLGDSPQPARSAGSRCHPDLCQNYGFLGPNPTPCWPQSSHLYFEGWSRKAERTTGMMLLAGQGAGSPIDRRVNAG